jgi:tRNA uridine 5-carboxymethylaminomethyl modification enzyme
MSRRGIPRIVGVRCAATRVSRRRRRSHHRHVSASVDAHRRGANARRSRGRRDDRGISGALTRSASKLQRFKTGTPPRLNGRTIDYAQMELQPGDDDPRPFSFLTIGSNGEQIPCYITLHQRSVHDLIRANLHRAPMYSGQIQSSGPRYCPSIEDKVVRFADKDRSISCSWSRKVGNTHEVYVNGVSTSLPRDVQDAMFKLIPGLERAEIMRYGYAVEYDFAPPEQLQPSAGIEARARACTLPARSTAPPATKRPARKA